MKLPFIKYLEAMVMARKDDAYIINKLNEMPIPLAKDFPEDAIKMVRNQFILRDPKYLKYPFKKDYPDMDLLKEIKIFDIVHYILKMNPGYPLNHITGAFELLYDPDMFAKMSSLAFANVSEEDIELIVQGKYNIHYDEIQIKNFFHLFFNVKDWTITDKKDYLKRIKDDELLEYYEMALDGDKDYLMWKLGIAPQKSFEAMLSDVTSDAYYFFKERSKSAPNEAQSWASVFLRTIERVEKLQNDKDKSADFFSDLDSLIEDAKARSVDTTTRQNGAENSPLPHIATLNKDK